MLDRRTFRAFLLAGMGCALAPLWSQAGVPASAPAASSPASRPGPGPGFTSRSRGLVASGAISTSAAGDSLLGGLGGELFGLRTFRDPRWLWQWDALAELRGGELGNSVPYTRLFGGHVAGFTEIGRRLEPSRAFSAYAGARVSGDGHLLQAPGVPLSALDTVNDMDGVGGLGGSAAIRLDAGISGLDDWRSLLAVAYVQESLWSPGVVRPGAAFTDVGVAGRLDLAGSLLVSAEGLVGWAADRVEPALGVTDQAAHAALAVDARKVFRNGMWVGVALALGQQTDHLTYAGSPHSYDTADAPSFALDLAYGFPLGGPR